MARCPIMTEEVNRMFTAVELVYLLIMCSTIFAFAVWLIMEKKRYFQLEYEHRKLKMEFSTIDARYADLSREYRLTCAIVDDRNEKITELEAEINRMQNKAPDALEEREQREQAEMTDHFQKILNYDQATAYKMKPSAESEE